MSAHRLITPSKRRAAAETLSRRLPPLLLEAQRVAATVAMGVHGRRRSGTGEQFWQYRPSMAGDSLSQIDWRASARSPHLLIRQREWETAQTAFIWLDRSESLNWRSSPKLPTKAMRAELLSLALCDLLLRGGERVGYLGLSEKPLSGRSALNQLALTLHRAPDDGAAWPTTLNGLNPRHTRAAKLILIGDFLDDTAPLAAWMKKLAALGLTGTALQVLDPAERAPNWQGRLRFTGLEGEKDFLAPRAEHMMAAYQNAFAAHQAQVRATFATLGWAFLEHTTTDKPELALMALYEALSRDTHLATLGGRT